MAKAVSSQGAVPPAREANEQPPELEPEPEEPGPGPEPAEAEEPPAIPPVAGLSGVPSVLY